MNNNTTLYNNNNNIIIINYLKQAKSVADMSMFIR